MQGSRASREGDTQLLKKAPVEAHFLALAGLTAMADYQVPRVLRALGVLEYCPSLADRINRHDLLEEGGPEELAIRAATIIACEAIAAHTGGTSADIDNLLWLSQDIAGDAPFHLTETPLY